MKKLKGVCWDEIYERDPQTGEIKLVKVTEPTSNAIVDAQDLMVAALVGNLAGFKGIAYHAFGSGDSAWDTLGVPAVDPGDTTLVNEVFRKEPDSINFLDGSDNPVVGPTTNILVKTTLDFGDALGLTIREHGLFGGDATATPDSGQMIDVFRDAPGFVKGNIRVVRQIKLTVA